MENYFNIRHSFYKNVMEVLEFLEFSMDLNNGTIKNVVYKSAVVIAVAYWEKFIEDLLMEGCTFLAEGLRDPLGLPENTRQAIVNSTVKHDSNSLEYCNNIWDYSGEGWTKQYQRFVEKEVRSFNTADYKNVKEAIWKVFGIRDVFQGWTTTDPSNPMSLPMLDKLIKKRHEIAHGSSGAMVGLDSTMIISSLKLLLELTKYVEKVVWEQIANIVKKGAKEYGLKSKYIYDIISYFRDCGFGPVTNKAFQRISQTANSNYNKLAYAPWGLLEIINPAEIKPTETMQKFIKGEVKLPTTIVVLKNQKAFEKKNSQYLSFQDLEKFFSSPES